MCPLYRAVQRDTCTVRSQPMVCSIFSGAGKFCLAHVLGTLTRDVKSDVRNFNFRSDVTFAPLRKTPNDFQNVRNGRNAEGYIILFNAIGKKNNQTSVSDAGRQIATLGSKDNAGKSVNLVSGIIRSPSGWDFSICSETDSGFYLSSHLCLLSSVIFPGGMVGWCDGAW